MLSSGHMKLYTKLNLILSCLLIGLFLLTTFLTYRDQREMVRRIALEEARDVSAQLITTFNHMSEIVRDEPETNYALVPQVVATQIAKKISAGNRYSVRQVSLRYRNPDNRPDAYESKQLQALDKGADTETYRITKNQTEDVFRYMKASVADESCLKCHGSYESAPAFIQQRFPENHPSYNYRVGEVIGAVSVSRAMTDLDRNVANRLKQALLYRGGMLLAVILVVWIFVRQLVIKRIESASATIHRITTTGSLAERIPLSGAKDEIGQLLIDFNAMMNELDRTTLQRQEVEERYRSLIEVAQSAIVTFLENGKIIISNQQAEQLIGLTRTRLLGESFFDYFEDSQLLQAKVASFARSGKAGRKKETARYRFRDAAGRTKELEITLVLASQTEQKPMFTAILRAEKNHNN